MHLRVLKMEVSLRLGSCATQPAHIPTNTPHSPIITSKMPAPSQFLEYVDSNANKFIKRLADAVAIPR